MKTKLLAVGMIAVGVMYVGYSQYSNSGTPQTTKTGGCVLATPGGRYVFGVGQPDNPVLSSFMLDTQTGRLWHFQFVGDPNKHNLALMPIGYSLPNGKTSLQPMNVEEEVKLLQETNSNN